MFLLRCVHGKMDLNDFYLDMRDNHDILIVSDEMGKSKPASLFFISKFGCLVETVKFYSESTINSMWDSIDVLLTANPTLLLKKYDKTNVMKELRRRKEFVKSSVIIRQGKIKASYLQRLRSTEI